MNTKTDKLEIGKRIRTLRMTMRLDQETLGKRVGVSRAAISAYECGRMCPTAEITAELAEVLGVESKEIVSQVEREWIKQAEAEQRAEAMRKMHLRRREMREAEPKSEKPPQRERPAWMEQARCEANERRERDAYSQEKAHSRRKRRDPEPETGATSGFVSDEELKDMPAFLHELLIDMHIRRMLFLCGEYGRLGNVTKTRTPLGVVWSVEEATA